jgi:hypothetical protein
MEGTVSSPHLFKGQISGIKSKNPSLHNTYGHNEDAV